MLKYSDFIGKRLDDAIKYMPDDAILHIGSRTGFLFVGDKAHYYRDIKKVNADIIKTQEAIAETAKRKNVLRNQEAYCSRNKKHRCKKMYWKNASVL